MMNNVEQLQKHMVRVVKREILSPIYPYFETLEEELKENTDNSWWVKEDPRWQLLLQINQKGFLTTCAEEGNLQPGPRLYSKGTRGGFWFDKGFTSADSRCCLDGFLKRTDAPKIITRWKTMGLLVFTEGKGLGKNKTLLLATDLHQPKLERYPLVIIRGSKKGKKDSVEDQINSGIHHTKDNVLL